MNGRSVPDNGGVPLEETTEEERVNEVRRRRENPDLTVSPHGIDTGFDDVDTIVNPIAPTYQPTKSASDQPTGKLLACGDCGVYYPKSGDGWEFCPQCASELETFNEAGESK